MAVTGKITNLESIGEYFTGNGDVVIFDQLTLSSAGLTSLRGAKSIGDIKKDTLKWNGSDPNESQIKNEQDEVIVSKTEAGAFGFEFTALSTSAAMLAKLIGATTISETFVTGDTFAVGSVVTGFGTALPVIECPVAIFNADLGKAFVFPNGKITSSLATEDGVACLKCKVTAQKVDTAKLKTVMFVKGAANYTVDPA